MNAAAYPPSLAQALLDKREAGRKLLVPYCTGGLGRDWLETVRAIAGAGADAIEIGIPFSDPVMDGPVIQLASQRALAEGATPQQIISDLSRADVSVPLAVMTYANIIARAGFRRMAHRLVDAGVTAAIIPDLPVDECEPWAEAADAVDLATVLLAAPTTPDDRLAQICARSRGFVYAVGVLGVTGEREQLAASALEIARRLKAITDLPVLVGVGVSTPEHAYELCKIADGVVVGSALVRRIVDGEGPDGAAAFVSDLRRALDSC